MDNQALAILFGVVLFGALIIGSVLSRNVASADPLGTMSSNVSASASMSN